jgi:transporter family protein
MNYLPWAVLALVAYSLVPPLVRLSTQDLDSTVVALVTNGILVVAALGIVIARGENFQGLTSWPSGPYMLAAGIALAVGILAYYRALELGPVSVVTPIFGMFLVTSSVVGVLFLEESLTARKVAGIGLAVVAVYLTTAE